LTTSEAHIATKELHGMAKGHFVVDITAKKILDAGYWWPILFNGILGFCKSCDAYQKIRGLKTKSLAKLVRTLLEEPFMK
jgi:hypothetical protein